MTATPKAFGQVESCDRDEWTGEGKADSIKSQRQETQLGVFRDSKAGYKDMLRCYDVIVTSSGYGVLMTSRSVWTTRSRGYFSGVIRLLGFAGASGVSLLGDPGVLGGICQSYSVIPFVILGLRVATDVIVR